MLELEAELSAVDKELEDKQSMHEQVVHALKEVRRLSRPAQPAAADVLPILRSSTRPRRASRS